MRKTRSDQVADEGRILKQLRWAVESNGGAPPTPTGAASRAGFTSSMLCGTPSSPSTLAVNAANGPAPAAGAVR
jgi:hypothetical protein